VRSVYMSLEVTPPTPRKVNVKRTTISLLLAVSAFGCSDEPLSNDQPIGILERSPGINGSPPLDASVTNTCFTSIRKGPNSPQYSYSVIRVGKPSASANMRRFYFRKWNSMGRTVGVANCILDAQDANITALVARFSRPSRPGGQIGGFISSAMATEDYCYWYEDYWVCDGNFPEDDSPPKPPPPVEPEDSTSGFTKCTVGKHYDTFTKSCVCDNGADNPDCLIIDGPGEPPPTECDPNYTSCGSPSIGTGVTPCTTCSSEQLVVKCMTPVKRGDSQRCSISASMVISDPQMVFTGGGITNRASTSDWEGTVVAGGEVSATVKVADGSTRPATPSSFTVENRGWFWSASRWSWTAGTCNYGPAYNPPFHSEPTAYNCPNISKVELDGSKLYIMPNFAARAGYIVESIPAGPNANLAYVSGWGFYIQSGSAVHPGLVAGSSFNMLLPFDQSSECRLGYPAYVNWYTFNSRCKGVDVESVLAALHTHEKGHYNYAIAEAAKETNDPGKLLDGIFAANADLVHGLVADRLRGANGRIAAAADRQPPPGPGVTVWAWNTATSRYVSFLWTI
jgi:hypothetical protein